MPEASGIDFDDDPVYDPAYDPAAVAAVPVVILCGGLGTRLREETEFKPKPMVEIGGRPILWHIMKHYHHYGAKTFVICLGYRGDVIRDYFLNYRLHHSDIAIDFANGEVETLANGYSEDWRVLLVETGRDTLTGARIKKALAHIDAPRFFATYGDGVSNVDIGRLLAHHERSAQLATVTAVHPSSRYGELAINGGMVRAFREKPQVTEGWINGGFFTFERGAFDGISADANPSLEEGVLECLAERHELGVYQHGGFWQCMDTYREMQLLNELWAHDDAPWRVWDRCPATV